MLGRQIAAFLHPPSSVIELKRALQEAWNRLSPQFIHHLIASDRIHQLYYGLDPILLKPRILLDMCLSEPRNVGNIVSENLCICSDQIKAVENKGPTNSH
ncbi:hypothetical protein TNCV_3642611 [Trichonephila clavipes]|nr:hypothetical protein TNCV_3642611 [Trichonephila clavipes]